MEGGERFWRNSNHLAVKLLPGEFHKGDQKARSPKIGRARKRVGEAFGQHRNWNRGRVFHALTGEGAWGGIRSLSKNLYLTREGYAMGI